MLLAKPFTSGFLRGTIYDCSEIGDGLLSHEHDETTNHITIVTKGEFMATGNGWQQKLIPGPVYEWQVNDPHEILAIVSDSRMINIITGRTTK